MTSRVGRKSTARQSCTVCVAVVVIVVSIIGQAHSQPRSCALRVSPDNGFMRVDPGDSVMFVCNARCLGPLSRDQLVWKDPDGFPVPGLGPDRIHSVNYNRWMMSRLVILSAQPRDSGTYTCEVLHGERLLQYTAVLQVKDVSERDNDPGPRRGDIFIEPDPNFAEIRPVRSVSRHSLPDSRGVGEGSPSSRPVDTKIGFRNQSPFPRPALPLPRLESAAETHPRVADDVADVARYFNVKNEDRSDVVRVRRQAGDVNDTTAQDSINSTDPVSSPSNFTTPIPSAINTTNSGPDYGDDVTRVPDTVVTLVIDQSDSSTASMDSPTKPDLGSSSLPATLPSKTSLTSKQPMYTTSTPKMDTTSTTPSVTKKPASTTPSVTKKPASTTPSVTKKPASTMKPYPGAKTTWRPTTTTKRSGSGSGSGRGGSRTAGNRKGGMSGLSTESGGETAFGRYGMLAFGLTLGAALLLLYALLLVILVPRCRKRKKKHTLNLSPESPPSNDGRYTARQGAESNLIPMGERPHKPLAPMTSATGLNGEYITSVDLDAKTPTTDDDRKEDSATGAAGDDGKTESEGKDPQESYVSSFLIGRLSSSKPTDENIPDDVTMTPHDDNVFGSAESADDAGKVAESGDDKAKGADSKPPKDSDSESSASSSPDEGEAKLDSSDSSAGDAAPSSPAPNDAPPSSPGPEGATSSTPAPDAANDAGLMSEIHLEVSPAGITVDDTPTEV